eukprot:2481023-Prorocentrum_lima.AAC.1
MCIRDRGWRGWCPYRLTRCRSTRWCSSASPPWWGAGCSCAAASTPQEWTRPTAAIRATESG